MSFYSLLSLVRHPLLLAFFQLTKNEIQLPKIIDDLAKFDGRKKRYVPYPSILKDSDAIRKREIQLLADLQTKWDSLKKTYPGNIRFIKSFNKHYRQVLWPNDRIFLALQGATSYADGLWLPQSQVIGQFQRDFNEQLRLRIGFCQNGYSILSHQCWR